MTENDPASNRGHVYWRHPGPDTGAEPAAGACSMVLQDATPSWPANPTAFVFAVLALIALIALAWFGRGHLLPGQPLPRGHDEPGHEMAREAIVAVLLVVPGFLYARLDLPPRQSILGRLRGLPRLIAYFVIACAAGLAAVVAGGAGDEVLRWAFLVAFVAVLLSLGLVGVARLHAFRHRPTAAPGLPRWARLSDKGQKVSFVTFSAVDAAPLEPDR
jgi:hypothetical protein